MSSYRSEILQFPNTVMFILYRYLTMHSASVGICEVNCNTMLNLGKCISKELVLNVFIREIQRN